MTTHSFLIALSAIERRDPIAVELASSLEEDLNDLENMHWFIVQLSILLELPRYQPQAEQEELD